MTTERRYEDRRKPREPVDPREASARLRNELHRTRVSWLCSVDPIDLFAVLDAYDTLPQKETRDC